MGTDMVGYNWINIGLNIGLWKKYLKKEIDKILRLWKK
jgi:hypothetical protein